LLSGNLTTSNASLHRCFDALCRRWSRIFRQCDGRHRHGNAISKLGSKHDILVRLGIENMTDSKAIVLILSLYCFWYFNMNTEALMLVEVSPYAGDNSFRQRRNPFAWIRTIVEFVVARIDIVDVGRDGIGDRDALFVEGNAVNTGTDLDVINLVLAIYSTKVECVKYIRLDPNFFQDYHTENMQ